MTQLKREREEEFNSMTSKFLNQNKVAEAVVSYTDLINKIDLVLKNQEVIVDLLSRENIQNPSSTKSISRRVYKELVANKGRIIHVGYVLPFSQILEFDIPKKITNHDSFIKNLNVYYPEFYVESSENSSVYNLFKPSNDVIEIIDKTKDTYCATGFLLDDGRVVYYDQYL